MTRNMLTFAILLLFFGSIFAGNTVSVGETVPVGGTTTTTTTTTTDPDPEPEPEPGQEMPGGFDGMGLTNSEGETILVGDDIEVVDGEGDGAGKPASESSSEGGSEDEAALGVGLPAGGSSESPTTEEESACGTAFALLAVAAFFARRS
ncbi:MAG: hypothetical protein GY852_06555 [bacterium]|nr:hypothetical protein [bacterium]